MLPRVSEAARIFAIAAFLVLVAQGPTFGGREAQVAASASPDGSAATTDENKQADKKVEVTDKGETKESQSGPCTDEKKKTMSAEELAKTCPSSKEGTVTYEKPDGSTGSLGNTSGNGVVGSGSSAPPNPGAMQQYANPTTAALSQVYTPPDSQTQQRIDAAFANPSQYIGGQGSPVSAQAVAQAQNNIPASVYSPQASVAPGTTLGYDGDLGGGRSIALNNDLYTNTASLSSQQPSAGGLQAAPAYIPPTTGATMAVPGAVSPIAAGFQAAAEQWDASQPLGGVSQSLSGALPPSQVFFEETRQEFAGTIDSVNSGLSSEATRLVDSFVAAQEKLETLTAGGLSGSNTGAIAEAQALRAEMAGYQQDLARITNAYSYMQSTAAPLEFAQSYQDPARQKLWDGYLARYEAAATRDAAASPSDNTFWSVLTGNTQSQLARAEMDFLQGQMKQLTGEVPMSNDMRTVLEGLPKDRSYAGQFYGWLSDKASLSPSEAASCAGTGSCLFAPMVAGIGKSAIDAVVRPVSAGLDWMGFQGYTPYEMASRNIQMTGTEQVIAGVVDAGATAVNVGALKSLGVLDSAATNVARPVESFGTTASGFSIADALPGTRAALATDVEVALKSQTLVVSAADRIGATTPLSSSETAANSWFSYSPGAERAATVLGETGAQGVARGSTVFDFTPATGREMAPFGIFYKSDDSSASTGGGAAAPSGIGSTPDAPGGSGGDGGAIASSGGQGSSQVDAGGEDSGGASPTGTQSRALSLIPSDGRSFDVRQDLADWAQKEANRTGQSQFVSQVGGGDQFAGIVERQGIVLVEEFRPEVPVEGANRSTVGYGSGGSTDSAQSPVAGQFGGNQVSSRQAATVPNQSAPVSISDEPVSGAPTGVPGTGSGSAPSGEGEGSGQATSGSSAGAQGGGESASDSGGSGGTRSPSESRSDSESDTDPKSTGSGRGNGTYASAEAGSAQAPQGSAQSPATSPTPSGGSSPAGGNGTGSGAPASQQAQVPQTPCDQVNANPRQYSQADYDRCNPKSPLEQTLGKILTAIGSVVAPGGAQAAPRGGSIAIPTPQGTAQVSVDARGIVSAQSGGQSVIAQFQGVASCYDPLNKTSCGGTKYEGGTQIAGKGGVYLGNDVPTAALKLSIAQQTGCGINGKDCVARVTNIATGQSVEVRINDNGPLFSNRVIDLNPAAKQAIGAGDLSNVRVEILGRAGGATLNAGVTRSGFQMSISATAPGQKPVEMKIQAAPAAKPVSFGIGSKGSDIDQDAYINSLCQSDRGCTAKSLGATPDTSYPRERVMTNAAERDAEYARQVAAAGARSNGRQGVDVDNCQYSGSGACMSLLKKMAEWNAAHPDKTLVPLVNNPLHVAEKLGAAEAARLMNMAGSLGGGAIVERGAGTPAQNDALRKAAGVPNAPILFVGTRSEIDPVEAAIASGKLGNMGTSVSSASEGDAGYRDAKAGLPIALGGSAAPQGTVQKALAQYAQEVAKQGITFGMPQQDGSVKLLSGKEAAALSAADRAKLQAFKQIPLAQGITAAADAQGSFVQDGVRYAPMGSAEDARKQIETGAKDAVRRALQSEQLNGNQKLAGLCSGACDVRSNGEVFRTKADGTTEKVGSVRDVNPRGETVAAAQPRLTYRGGVAGLHPAIQRSMQEASKLLPPGYSVRVNNAARTGSTVGGGSFHLQRDRSGNALAADVSIIDASGKELRNIRSPETFGIYRDFMQNVKAYQDQLFPQLRDRGRWGGYFVAGVGQDLMHYDLGPRAMMAAGSWEGGLLSQYARYGLPGDVGKGMGALDKYVLPMSAASQPYYEFVSADGTVTARLPDVPDQGTVAAKITDEGGELAFAVEHTPPQADTRSLWQKTQDYARNTWNSLTGNGGAQPYDAMRPAGTAQPAGGSGGGSGSSGAGGSQPQQQPQQLPLMPAENTTAQPASLTCSPSAISGDAKSKVTIAWQCPSGTTPVGSGFSTVGTLSGSITVSVATTSASVRYGIACSGTKTPQTASCTVAVKHPAVMLVAKPGTLARGDSTKLEWKATDVTGCTLFAPPSIVLAKGTASGSAQTLPLETSTRFRVRCETGGTPITGSVVVEVPGSASAADTVLP